MSGSIGRRFGDYVSSKNADISNESKVREAKQKLLIPAQRETNPYSKVTVRSLAAFQPSIHVKVCNIRHSLKVTVPHLPRMKVSAQGEDIYFAVQPGDFDPLHALANHLQINNPPPSAHLFSWHHQGGLHPLTCSEFLCALERASIKLGIEPLKGHGLRIGGTLEYLLHGLSFKMVKVMGRWAGDAFIGYFRQHAIVLAPYLQDTPVLKPFMRYTLPPVR